MLQGILNKEPEFGRPGPRIDDKAPDAVNLRVDKLLINEGVSALPVVIKLRKRQIILIGQVTPMLLKAHKDTCVRGARNKVFQGLEIIGPKRANAKREVAPGNGRTVVRRRRNEHVRGGGIGTKRSGTKASGGI